MFALHLRTAHLLARSLAPEAASVQGVHLAPAPQLQAVCRSEEDRGGLCGKRPLCEGRSLQRGLPVPWVSFEVRLH